ncbi:MAG: glutamate-1-semialdehyde 2,1-aminomutase [Planctomycetota bacterium]
MHFDKSNKIRKRAHAAIPGGCHTYAKGDDQYPVLSPGFITHGKGCHVWDADGNEYIEYGMGNRAVGLGHAFEPVVDAVMSELSRGVNFTRPSTIEVECAEVFLDMIPGAEMVKFCKDGSAATSGALRLARALTGRDYVACCSSHPFFATNDWFIGTTQIDAGIPRCTADLTLGFEYNDLASLQSLFDKYPKQIAAIILEPAKYEDPHAGFLHQCKDLCHANGALFVLDEMLTGFRWHNGGGQGYYGIEPDLSTFGKALGNGFAISALAGKTEYMDRGGIYHDQERVFLLSTTHGAETHAMAAAIATINFYEENPVVEHIFRIGQRLLEEGNALIESRGLEDYVKVLGLPFLPVLSTCDHDGNSSQAFRSLFLQETIRKGVLMTTLAPSFSHSDKDVDRTLQAMDAALSVYRRALSNGVDRYLEGRPSQVVYRKFNNMMSPFAEVGS